MKIKLNPVPVLILCAVPFLAGCIKSVQGPGIHVFQEKYDFGVVEEGKDVSHPFEFINNGTETLFIEEVHPTCGCTIPEEYDKEIKPGQRGKIPLIFKTAGYEGEVTKITNVKTNVPDKKDIQLTFVGKVRMTILVNPRTLSLGSVERNRNTPIEGRINITNKMNIPLKLTNVVLSNTNVEAKIETIKDGFEYAVNVKVSPPFRDGQVMETVQVITDSKLRPEINTQFSYYMEPLVRVYPNPIFVSMEKIQKGEEQVINIQGQPEVNMQVTGLESNNKAVRLALGTVTAGKHYTINIRFPRDFKFEQNKTPTVRFKLKGIPNDPEFVVPLYSMGG